MYVEADVVLRVREIEVQAILSENSMDGSDSKVDWKGFDLELNNFLQRPHLGSLDLLLPGKLKKRWYLEEIYQTFADISTNVKKDFPNISILPDIIF